MPQWASMGKIMPSSGQHAFGIRRGECHSLLQRNCVGTGILKTELSHRRGEDRWLHIGSNDFFVPSKDLCQKCFVLLVVLINPFHLGFLLLFHPSRLLNRKREGADCEFAKLKETKPRPHSRQQDEGWNSLKTHGLALAEPARGQKAEVPCARQSGGGPASSPQAAGKGQEVPNPSPQSLKWKVCFLCKSLSPKCARYWVPNPLKRKSEDANFS